MDSASHAEGDEIHRLRRENYELRRRLADLESIITMLPVPIAMSEDAEASDIEVNPAFAALLGVDTDVNVSTTGSDAEKLPFHFLRSGKPADKDDLPLRRAGLTGQEVHDELEIVRDDGVRYHIFGTAKPLFDDVGNVRRTFGAFVEISDRKRAERALQQSIEAICLRCESRSAGTAPDYRQFHATARTALQRR
jgi:PAS domain S-box-containing protein